MLNEELFLNWVGHFFLIFLRVAAIFTVSPVFGRKSVPSIAKIMFSILLAYILVGIYPPPDQPRTFNVYAYGFDCIKELIVGLTIGYLTTVFFAVTLTAGQINDVQVGFGMVQIFDPQAGMQVPLLGNLLNVIMLIAFFMVNGHHMLIRILAETFKYMPPGNFNLNTEVAMMMVDVFVLTLILAIKISMPVMAAIFLSEVALGLIIRTVPQMNMFVIGIPLKIILGLGLLILIVPIFMGVADSVFSEMFSSIQNAFARMVTA